MPIRSVVPTTPSLTPCSDAILALTLDSTGKACVRIYERKPGGYLGIKTKTPLPPLTSLPDGTTFTFSVAKDRVGLFSVQADDWPGQYDAPIVAALGELNPLGLNDITNSTTDPTNTANRIIQCEYSAGQLIWRDGRRTPGFENKVNIETFSSTKTIVLAIRVTKDQYAEECATLQFGVVAGEHSLLGKTFNLSPEF